MDADGARLVLPRRYEPLVAAPLLSSAAYGGTSGCGQGGPFGNMSSGAGVGSGITEPGPDSSDIITLYPPAVPQADAYTLEK